jgi:hypothetical protein
MSTTTATESEPVEVPTPAPAPTFTATERTAFQDEDRHAVMAVICVMVAIFTAAVIGYSVIAYLASCSL